MLGSAQPFYLLIERKKEGKWLCDQTLNFPPPKEERQRKTGVDPRTPRLHCDMFPDAYAMMGVVCVDARIQFRVMQPALTACFMKMAYLWYLSEFR